MPRTALTLYAILLALAVGLRAAVHKWQTGSFGLRLPSSSGASAESVVGALLALAALLVGVAAPLWQLAGMVTPWPVFGGVGSPAVPVILFAVGLAGVLVSQFSMGASWRVGVDPGERTRLITSGPFTFVRNPIYTCMLLAILGVSLLVPNVVTLLAFALLVLAIELQVRVIEEPYLLRVHGQSYADWSARVGRFFPGVGEMGAGGFAGLRVAPAQRGRLRGGTCNVSRDSGGAPSLILPRTAGATLSEKLEPGSDRLHAFDALRAIAMLLGIVLHGAMSYMDLRLTPLTWVHYDHETSRVLSWIFWWIHGFRLQLFFLLAGFFAAHLYARRGASAFLAHRATSLLLPFIVGCIVLLPLIYYIFAAGWWLRGACTWNEIRRTTFLGGLQDEVWGPAHLWFIEYLILYCLLYWLVRVARPRASPQWMARMLSSRWRVLWCGLPTFMLLLVDDTVITTHHNTFIPQPVNVLFYGVFFGFGSVLHGMHGERGRFIRSSAATLFVSLLFFAGVDSGLRAHAAGRLDAFGHAALCACLALFAWSSIFGFLGQAQRWLDRPHPRVRYLSDAAYWVYLIHMPIVALLQLAIAVAPIPALLKCGIVVGVTATICLWSYERWVRHSFIGALLRGRWTERPIPAVGSVLPAPVGPASAAGGP